MKLTDIIRILELNPLWKSSSEDQKITAINQFLNDLIYEEEFGGRPTATKFTFDIEKYETVTFKNLQKTLETDLTEQQIFDLFQYTLQEMSFFDPYDFVTVTSVITRSPVKEYKVNQSLSFIKRNQIGKEYFLYLLNKVFYRFMPEIFDMFSFNQSAKYFLKALGLTNTYGAVGPVNVGEATSINSKAVYRIRDIYTSKTYPVDYLVTYNIWD